MSLLPKRAALVALALLPLFAAGAALAQDSSSGEHSGGGPRSRPCRADVEKLCSGIKPGGGRIVACLHEHAADVSPACHDAMAAHERAHPSGGAEPDSSK
jgi:hypothetical protein